MAEQRREADWSEHPPDPEIADAAGLPVDWDADLYLLLNPDVAAMVKSGAYASAASHWRAKGCDESRVGRRPSIDEDRFYRFDGKCARPPSEVELAAFDPDWYVDHHLDIGTLVGRDNAVDHWVAHGRYEGRSFFDPNRVKRRRLSLRRLAARPFGVNFYAPFSARSGLGSAARGYLRALRSAGVPVDIYNLNIDRHPELVTTQDYDRLPRYRINLIQANADTIERVFAHFRLDQFDDSYTIGLWAWELNILRPDWFAAFGLVDEVWTLSEANTAAVAAVAPVPVRTMNCALPVRAAITADRAAHQLPPGFLFLTAFDAGSSLERKNPQAVIDAFLDCFSDRDDVHLLLKFHSGQNDPISTRMLLERVRGQRNIIIRSEKLDETAMASLQQCCDCLVSAHRSEGFGLNIAEFMALGKPVIVTGFSGNMDFTTPSNSFLVGYDAAPVIRASGPYFPGYLWAEPDAAELRQRMRQVVEQPDVAAERGAAGAASVLAALSPAAVGERLRARLEELGLTRDLPAYATLLGGSADLAMPPPPAVREISDPLEQARHPVLSVIVPVYNVAPEWLVRCIESVRRQDYVRWELCLCDDASSDPATLEVLRRYQGLDPRIRIARLPRNGGIATASNAAVLLATGRYVLMLDNDDELAGDALQHVARAVIADPSIDVLYADEDKLGPRGRRVDHYYKPDWSPEHLESVMYTLHPLTVRTSLFLEIGGFRPDYSGAQDYDLMLRLSRRTGRIHHIPKLLYHWRKIPGSAAAEVDAKPAALTAARRALEDHVQAKYGALAKVEPGLLPGLFRVRHRIVDEPPVSIMIMTRNTVADLPGRGRFIMVDNLVQSIAAHTAYRNVRTVVIDHGNSSAEQRALYRRLGVVLHSYDGPTAPFNYSDKANWSLSRLDTDHVVLMNDDMEVFDPDWLSALLEFSQQPDIGACGGKLLFADGALQHAGVVFGPEDGGTHIYRGFPGDFVGYNGFTHVIRNYSALTAACLATRRSVLAEIGGFDRSLAIDYNDMDLCLRMRRNGYRIVYTPHSQVYHFESMSAKRTVQNPAEVALFRSRWRDVIDNDPYYNVNLTRKRNDFAER